ncbi:uncharacterized protein CcaverHIS019_0507720 [Cutaneotrichosporon cavernicola]|uniref:ER to Golgi transport-related protein n=1 Tax=Cutaneotrichosporon cavernicola TaxID=279322 RepID=A0AA48L707_9TREE|nr:uncharacterized protein CcaverHIS019_0507720 [Cutaneotrichosporon cavernicola]BEI93144.1 hypothetical protein CcaverHIS019_0507720 [Cutaneotrichosporon cavernicola]
MGRNGFFGAFQGLDAFGKTMEDVRIRTRTGALLTFISFSIILTSVLLEFVDYRRIRLEPSLEVDRSRGEKLVIEMDIEFPRVPCYMLSLDVMDLSGERQHDVSHEMSKQRISADGTYLEEKRMGQLKGDVERAAQNKDPNYCGSCYGASPPENGCCNSCEEVRQAYVRQGWSFVEPDGIEQCVEEGWSEKMEQQNEEGCRLSGQVRVNKVIGNLHFSYGSTFMRRGMDVAQLVPYLQDRNHHDFGHRIFKFHFGADVTPAEKARMDPKERTTRDRLRISDPLQGRQNHRHNDKSNFMYQIFVKVVSTTFVYLNGDEIPTNQYSVTSYERDLAMGNRPSRDDDGRVTSHHTQAIPGVFINYEISPMKVIHTETRQSFAHFVTSTCAIVGGVLTVASLLDAAIFNSRKRLGKEYEGGQYGGVSGKMM